MTRGWNSRNADWAVQVAYDREVSSCSFWPENESYPHPAFYCYLYPKPDGYKTTKIAIYGSILPQGLGEFILPYVIQHSEEADSLLLEFLSSTYNAGADPAHSDRDLLEF